jgi:hypothetical protein
MVEKSGRWRRILIIIFMTILATPLISQGAGNTGLDWYCSEPKAHTGDYKTHIRLHIDRGAKNIAAKLEKIYTNQSLSSEEKQDKTIEILNKYLVHIKAGMGD